MIAVMLLMQKHHEHHADEERGWMVVQSWSGQPQQGDYAWIRDGQGLPPAPLGVGDQRTEQV